MSFRLEALSSNYSGSELYEPEKLVSTIMTNNQTQVQRDFFLS